MDRAKTGFTRRHGIKSLLGGSLLMPGLLSELMADTNPLAPKAPHFPGKAKRVIFLYMTGGVSHIESFDPKPKLIADHGKTMPGGTYLIRPHFAFKQYGQSGTAVSELFPNVAECVDDICVIRSMKNDHGNHNEALLGIHTGSVNLARPSMGSWISYGLGTMNQNLPSYVVMAPQIPYAGTMGWQSDFLPACHQGTRIMPGSEPIPNLKGSIAPELQEMELGLADYFNSRHFAQRKTDTVLAARIKSFETAFGMQREAPEAFDLSKESDATLKLYGLERGQQTGFGWQCLVGRRLSERGVRFVELIDVGTDSEANWDSHTSMDLHIPVAKNVDKPISGLLKDLKSRGMLQDTLVIWTTEFGRAPNDGNPVARGRGHHPKAYSSWLAGGGIKPGITYGETDEYGINVASNRVDIHDFHATVLHVLGFDHTKLTYRYSGRDFRLTDVSGRVVKDILT
jgi:hypothetical protein